MKNNRRGDKSNKVMFVCLANVNRSQIGKVLFNHLTGTENADASGVGVIKYHPNARTVQEFDMVWHRGSSWTINALKRHNIDVSDLPRTQLTPKMVASYGLVVHFLEPGKKPKYLSGDNVIYWKVTDPHGESLEKVLASYDEIEPRVNRLIEILLRGGDVHELDDKVDED